MNYFRYIDQSGKVKTGKSITIEPSEWLKHQFRLTEDEWKARHETPVETNKPGLADHSAKSAK